MGFLVVRFDLQKVILLGLPKPFAVRASNHRHLLAYQVKGERMCSDSFFTVRRVQPSSISVAGGGFALPPATPKRSSSNSSQRPTGMLRYGILPSGVTLHV